METSDELFEAYAGMDFEIVENTPHLKVPSATPAVFDYDPDVENGASVCKALRSEGFKVLAPYHETRSDGSWFLNSTVYCCDTGQTVKIKMNYSTVRIYPENSNLSFETLERLVDHVEDVLDVELQHQGANQ